MRRAALLTALAVLGLGASAASAARPEREPLQLRPGGFLTAPSEDRPAAVALHYVRAHPGEFGLDGGDLEGMRLVRSYRSDSGAAHLQWEQRYRGIPVFGAGLRANLDADGRLLNVGDGALPDPAVDSIAPRLSALEALLAAARAVGEPVVPGGATTATGAERATTFTRGHRAGLTLFGERPRLAWRVLLRAGPREVYDAVVDATTGQTLYRVSLVREASGSAFDNYPGAPVGGTQVVKPFPETGADPWVTDPTRLFGDNAHVYSDTDDDIDGFPPDPVPVAGDEIGPSAPGEWNYPHVTQPAGATGQHCPATPGCSWSNFDTSFSWSVNRAQAATQLFYYVNRFHDHLRDAAGIGFDDSSGNFEGIDRVQAQVDDGATTETEPMFEEYPACDHLNNAFVIPVPDGTPLVMQLYLWSNACTRTQLALHDVNSADDALIVYHEYTHGFTNRLVTDAAGFPALNGPQPAAMDEGFADWYALDLLNGQGLEPDSAAPGELIAGRYENDQLRTQPFDCPVDAPASACPGTGGAGPGGYTYGDFGKIVGTPEVHADGEIWVQTLWDLRTRMIADHGAPEGIARARALVTDGLRLAPANPSFLDMRNAILQADTNRGFGDSERIWAVFAGRGMGFRAGTTGNLDATPRQDFSLPVAVAAAPPAGDTFAPTVSRLSMTRRRFAVGGGGLAGTVFRFRLSESGSARISIDRALAGRRVARRCRPAKRSLRHRPRCTRYVRVGTLVRGNLRPGSQRVTFSGRIRRRALRPGLHRATITVTDAAGNRSSAVVVSFRVVRR